MPKDHMLSVKDLSLTFRNSGRTALDGLSFSLPDHGMFLLSGDSGAGKSTLLSVIGSLEKPDAGEVSYNGTDVPALQGKALRAYRRDVAVFLLFLFRPRALFDGQGKHHALLRQG